MSLQVWRPSSSAPATMPSMPAFGRWALSGWISPTTSPRTRLTPHACPVPHRHGRHSVPQPRGHPHFAPSSPRASSPTLRGGRAWRSSRAHADFAVRLSSAEEFVALLATLGMGVDGVFGGDAPTAAAAVAAAATSSPPASMAVQSYLWGVGGEGQCRSGFEMKLGGCAAALSRLGRLSHGSGSRGCRWCVHPCCPTPSVYSSCLLFPMQPPADAPFALKRRSAASFFSRFSDCPRRPTE